LNSSAKFVGAQSIWLSIWLSEMYVTDLEGIINDRLAYYEPVTLGRGRQSHGEQVTIGDSLSVVLQFGDCVVSSLCCTDYKTARDQ